MKLKLSAIDDTDNLTVDAKYIYIDIVNYTYNRSVEAQAYIVSILNKIVTDLIISIIHN